MPHVSDWHVESRDGRTIVTVSGPVDTRSGPALLSALTQCLRREPSAVVVELTRATLTDPKAATVFTTLVQEAQLWPGTPVLFCTPDATTAAMITAAGEAPPPLYATVTEALSALTGHDGTVSELLLPVKGAARRARDITTEACVRWDLPHLVAPATLVASELVTNAVKHAHTVMTLQVRLRPRYLYLAVFDDTNTEPVLRSERPADTPGGRGLHLVELTATRWGHQRQPHGKVVWASFDTLLNARTFGGTPGEHVPPPPPTSGPALHG